jgi:hypothetical protein
MKRKKKSKNTRRERLHVEHMFGFLQELHCRSHYDSYLAVTGSATTAYQNQDAMKFCVVPRVHDATTSTIDYIVWSITTYL